MVSCLVTRFGVREVRCVLRFVFLLYVVERARRWVEAAPKLADIRSLLPPTQRSRDWRCWTVARSECRVVGGTSIGIGEGVEYDE